MKNDNTDLRDHFRTFLFQNRFLPLSSHNPKWKHIEIIHSKLKPPKAQLREFRKSLKAQLQCGGVYAYLNRHGSLLYFGKSKNIYNRARSHHRSAFERTGGDHPGVWHEFFSNNAGKLTFLWRSVKHDRQRIALEEMIEDVVRSKFDRLYPRGKRKRRAT